MSKSRRSQQALWRKWEVSGGSGRRWHREKTSLNTQGLGDTAMLSTVPQALGQGGLAPNCQGSCLAVGQQDNGHKQDAQEPPGPGSSPCLDVALGKWAMPLHRAQPAQLHRIGAQPESPPGLLQLSPLPAAPGSLVLNPGTGERVEALASQPGLGHSKGALVPPVLGPGLV